MSFESLSLEYQRLREENDRLKAEHAKMQHEWIEAMKANGSLGTVMVEYMVKENPLPPTDVAELKPKIEQAIANIEAALQSWKKAALLIPLLLLPTGCDVTPSESQRAATQTMPRAEIVPLPASTRAFIARDEDGSIWFIDAMNGRGNFTTNVVPVKILNPPARQ